MTSRGHDAVALLELHDRLLFACAHPESAEHLRAARAGLRRVADAARRIMREGPAAERRTIAASGIAWSTPSAQFGLDICRWLVGRHPAHAEITAFGDDGASVAELLTLALPAVEAETLAAASDEDSLALLARLAGHRGGSSLRFLVRAIDRIAAPAAVRERLFESLQAIVTLDPRASTLSRTFARGIRVRAHYQRMPLARRVDFAAIVRSRAPAAARLSRATKEALGDVARATLCALSRETDPISAMAVDGVALHDLGRGAQIALYPTHPDRRLALDAHVGYLLLRNAVPAGYGGGWPFGATCRIGINIFPAARGGESAWLFAQVLRIYRHRFGARRFLVEPYQFGAGNREGRDSGAFWFYYRNGFRPVDAPIAALAASEAATMAADPSYRSPPATLRRLVEVDLEFRVDARPLGEEPDPSDLAHAVSARIAREFRGDRNLASRAAQTRVRAALGVRDDRRWPADERAAFEALALAVDLIPDLEGWPLAARRACVAWIRAKGRADDSGFFRALAGNARLRAALTLAARG